MEMKMMVGVMVVIGALVVQCATAQTLHVVGDDLGWTILQGGADAYATWAASQRFMVDDILMFNFTTDYHDVVEVAKESFDTCSGSNPIGSVITRGPANITLVSPGSKYFICTFSQHCQFGQKLAVTVSSSAASGGGSPPTTPPATPSPPTTGIPADCAPVPASSPSSGGPTPATTTTSNDTPVSSAHVVLGSFLVSIVSIVIIVLFL